MFTPKEPHVHLRMDSITTPDGRKRFCSVGAVVRQAHEHDWVLGYLNVTITHEDPNELETLMTWGCDSAANNLWVRYLQIPSLFAAAGDYGQGAGSNYTYWQIAMALKALTLKCDDKGQWRLMLPQDIKPLCLPESVDWDLRLSSVPDGRNSHSGVEEIKLFASIVGERSVAGAIALEMNSEDNQASLVRDAERYRKARISTITHWVLSQAPGTSLPVGQEAQAQGLDRYIDSLPINPKKV